MLALVFATLIPGAPPPVPAPRPPATVAEALDRGLYLPDGTVDRARLGRTLAAGCRGDDPFACLLLAGAVTRAPLAPIDALCDDGDLDACTYAAWRRTRRVPASAARAWWGGACERGALRACGALAALLVGTDPAGARQIAEPACTQGEPSACLARAAAEPTPAIRAAQLAALCADGDARGCAALARLSSPEGAYPDPAQRALAWLRGCGLGDRRACAPARAAWPSLADQLPGGPARPGPRADAERAANPRIRTARE